MNQRERVPVQITRVRDGFDDLPLPGYATAGAAGMDLRAAIEQERRIGPGETTIIPTGVAFALPDGYEGQVRPRSGLAFRHGISMLNNPGTIDADYRGEVAVLLVNHGPEPYTIERGERIAQLVVARYEQVSWIEVTDLASTDRGAGGFGSTGHN